MRCYIEFVKSEPNDCGFSGTVNFVGNALVLAVAGIALSIIGSSIANSAHLGSCGTTLLTTMPISIAIASGIAALAVAGLFLYAMSGSMYNK